MKGMVGYLIAVAVVLLLIPLPVLQPAGQAADKPVKGGQTPSGRQTESRESQPSVSSGKSVAQTVASTAPSVISATEDVFRVGLDSGVREIDAKTFLAAVVTCEMPLTYREEALKAQTVASYTYFSRRREEARKKKEKVDFSDVPSRFEEFSTEDGMKKALGAHYETYRATLTRVIEAVYGQVMCYQNQKILSVYHAIDAGITDSGKEVWNVDYPYLQAVPSPGDPTADGYCTEVVKSETELKACLTALLKKQPVGAPKTWVTVDSRLESGTVASLTVCGETITGTAFRKALGLRSANFEIAEKDENFIFTVKGYGHGVGMSQFGANYLAGQGADYKEILRHYYTGITIEKVVG